MSSSSSAPARRGSRRTDTPAGKVLAAGLAGATCLGLVGVIGIRSATDAAASNEQAANDATASTDAVAVDASLTTSSDGLTRQQLDEYAAKLADERQRLLDYRSYLVDVASQLQSVADANGIRISQTSSPIQTRSGATVTKKTNKAKAQAQAQAQAQQQAQPKPKPQRQSPSPSHAQTQGS